MNKTIGFAPVIQHLRGQGCILHCMDALEVFARDGTWHTMDYAPHVKTMEAWELQSIYIPELAKNLPGATIRQTDSIQMAEQSRHWKGLTDGWPAGRYDLVVVDNPMNTYGSGYCEHFDVIESAVALVRPGGVLVANVNPTPHDLDMFPEWAERRRLWYAGWPYRGMSLDQLRSFYWDKLAVHGRVIEDIQTIKRDDYVHYLVVTFEEQLDQRWLDVLN
jgi:hypothetical protein